MWAERKYNEDVLYLRQRGLLPVVNKTIIKVCAVNDDSNNYKETTGEHFMDEQTLILGDNKNNVYLVFDKDNGLVTTNNVAEHVHVVDRYHYQLGSIIHNKHEVAPLPTHLRAVFINNSVTHITNNFGTMNISDDKIATCFLETHYVRGGMCCLIDMKRHPEWIPTYKRYVTTKRINMFLKNCCSEYSLHNKTMRTMVVGWHC